MIGLQWRRSVTVLLFTFCFATSLPSTKEENAQVKPHIILIVADDLGWNDVSWHNPTALTPRLEELARGGVLLEQSYVQPVCTPTRSALMTGRYPFTIGRQQGVLWPEEPTGLTIRRKLLPQALKSAGYSTHAVGKWHLGFCSWDYTPTSRGFDTFWGYYTGAEDYYHHDRKGYFEGDEPPSVSDLLSTNPFDDDSEDAGEGRPFGYDFRNNTATEDSVYGVYSTYAFSSYIENLLESRPSSDPMFLYLPFQSVHSPLQVPDNYTEPFAHIKSEQRRIKLGMVLALDEAVGRVVDSLKKSGHYNNTVIIFTTDNGGPTVSAGNNWPLRGNKTTLWEGGTRGVAFVHSPLLPKKGIVSHKMIHVTDWFATLVGLGGGVTPSDTDGYDQWEAITTSATSPRTEMVYNIDVKDQVNAGIRMGDFKLLVGDPGPGEWTPAPEGDQIYSQDISSLTESEESHHDVNQSEFSDTELQNPTEIKEETNVSQKERSIRSIEVESETFVVEAVFNHNNGSTDLQRDNTTGKREEDFGIEENTKDLKPPYKEETGQEHQVNLPEAKNDLLTVVDLGIQPNHYMILKDLLSHNTSIRLYNITNDPEERNNIAAEKPSVVKILLNLIQYKMKDYVKPDILPNNPAANPKHWNNTWSPGWCRAK